ncbi:hypothetical protein E4U25_000254 [Claviceps purpurea]|nr:hypothetical protein E4U26_006145 [Claviceps purpurea]KAG6223455.1 hypothetical protein E4U25_000254 [Claviceps purpurea]KAG6271866.1 hypothetical protein E4U49_003225 [Claviceps purpurea]
MSAEVDRQAWSATTLVSTFRHFHCDLAFIAPVVKMRLLTALAFASGVSALATGPVQPLADQQTVQVDASINPENAVVAAPELTPKDETETSLELDKRMNGSMATIFMPQVADAAAVVIAGVSVSFIMASRVIRRQGQDITEWFVKRLQFHNTNPTNTVVQCVAGTIDLYQREMRKEFVETKDVPEGIRAFKMVVSQLPHGEL